MAYLTREHANPWLEQTKLQLPEVNDALDEVARSRVFGRLQTAYDTTGWVDAASSPSLVVQLVAMLYVASEYRKAYSEDLVDGTGFNWAEWLELTAMAQLEGLIDGSISIPEIGDTEDVGLRDPIFYPTDISSVDDPAKFTMGKVF